MKIEKNIPIPRSIAGRDKYRFGELEVGDSFLLEEGWSVRSAHSAASFYGKRNNKKFTIRKTEEGHRCWRLA